MQIRIIAFKTPHELINTCKSLFPNNDVKQHQAVDLRNVPVKDMLDTELITYSAELALLSTRKTQGHQLPSKGAVGLVHAVRTALSEDVTQPLLLFEEDCLINAKNKNDFVTKINLLLRYQHVFDLAVFGTLYQQQQKNIPVHFMPSEWIHITDIFYGLHCVLYTPRARAKLSQFLKRPIDMQLDSLYGRMAYQNELVVFAQSGYDYVIQRSFHASSIQKTSVEFKFILYVLFNSVLSKDTNFRLFLIILLSFVFFLNCHLKRRLEHKAGI